MAPSTRPGRASVAAAGALALVAAALAASTSLAPGAGALVPAACAAESVPDEVAPRAVAAAIDRAIGAAWKAEDLNPNPRCSDAEFVRRVHLDLVGTIPTATEVQEFLADTSPEKRSKLVDALLASPGFARHMTNQWADVLVGTGGDDKRDFVPGLFVQWLEGQFASDRPYGEWVTDLLTAEGTGYTNPAVNFEARKDHSPSDLAGSVSKAFLGVQIQCAQCHDHPYEDIRQEDFQAFSAFWGRIRLKPADIPLEMFGPQAVQRERQRIDKAVADMVRTGVPDAEARVRAERQKLRTREVSDLPGDARIPKAYAEGRAKGLGAAATATPRFLKGAVYEDHAGETRRQALARWITSPANPYTARALANRVWGWCLGRGIVQPVDDFSGANPPVVPEALDLLAADTAAHGFDVKRLFRIVTATRAYQTSTASKDRPRKAQALFAAGPLKPLTAQQSFDSLNVALGLVADGRTLTLRDSGPTSIEMSDGGRGGMMRMAMDGEYAQPDRLKVAMTQAARSFFQTFDDDEGGGDGTFEGTVPQGLFLLNSRVVNSMLSDRRVSVVPKIVATWKDEKDRVRQLFLRTLSREPAAAELSRFLKFVRESRPAAAPAPQGAQGARRGRIDEDAATAAYSDAMWALISSSEFGSNH